MTLRSLSIGVLLLGLVAAAVWLLRPSEPRRVRRQLDRLSERISKTESESSAVMALKMNALGDLFESQVEVELADFPGNGTYASSEIASHVARFRPAFRALQLSFHDVGIDMQAGGQAQARFTARLAAVTGNGERQEDTRPIRAALRQGSDGVWRFGRFEEISVLQR